MTLKGHFEPKLIVIVERYQFQQQNQKPGKPVANYIAEFCNLALHCKFGKFMNDSLWDHLVCGLDRKYSWIKKLLLQTDKAL